MNEPGGGSVIDNVACLHIVGTDRALVRLEG